MKLAVSPITIFGRTRNLKITLDLGLPNEDNEQFDLTTVGEPLIFHRRKNNEIWYYTYDSTNFELKKLLLSLLVSSFLLGDGYHRYRFRWSVGIHGLGRDRRDKRDRRCRTGNICEGVQRSKTRDEKD